MLVYVLNRHGEPLMPCSARKARLLLKQKKAVVKKREPFTIQLLYGSSGYKQEVSLGVDCGSKHIGMSATTEKKRVICGRCDSQERHHGFTLNKTAKQTNKEKSSPIQTGKIQ